MCDAVLTWLGLLPMKTRIKSSWQSDWQWPKVVDGRYYSNGQKWVPSNLNNIVRQPQTSTWSCIYGRSAQWELRPSPCDPGCRWPQSSDIPGSDYYQTWHINFMRGVGPVRRDTVSNKATVMFRVHALQYSTRCMHIFSSITRLFRGLSFVFRL